MQHYIRFYNSAALVFLFAFHGIAQDTDVITKKDGSLITGKVIQVTETAIEIDPTGDIPFLIIKRNDVANIKYQNGTVVKLGEVSAASSQEITKRQSWQINYKSGFGSGALVDKMIGKANYDIITGTVVGVGEAKAKNLEVKHKFTDKLGAPREIKLKIEHCCGIYPKFRVDYYVDDVLIETKLEKAVSSENIIRQWINYTIPGDRILLTTTNKVVDSGAKLLGVIDLIDRPQIELKEIEKIKEIRRNSTVLPLTLIEEEYKYANSMCHGCNFTKYENFFLGRDSTVHQISIEADYIGIILTCRFIIDYKIVKEASDDTGSSFTRPPKTLSFIFSTERGDTFDVSVHHKGDGVTGGRIIKVTQLN